VVNDQNAVEYRKVALGPVIDGLRSCARASSPTIGVVTVHECSSRAKVNATRRRLGPNGCDRSVLSIDAAD